MSSRNVPKRGCKARAFSADVPRTLRPGEDGGENARAVKSAALWISQGELFRPPGESPGGPDCEGSRIKERAGARSKPDQERSGRRKDAGRTKRRSQYVMAAEPRKPGVSAPCWAPSAAERCETRVRQGHKELSPDGQFSDDTKAVKASQGPDEINLKNYSWLRLRDPESGKTSMPV